MMYSNCRYGVFGNQLIRGRHANIPTSLLLAGLPRSYLFYIRQECTVSLHRKDYSNILTISKVVIRTR